MKTTAAAWVFGASLLVLGGCVAVGPTLAGGAGCRTIYVYRGAGGVQPVTTCAGVPRDTLTEPQGVSVQASLAARSTSPETPLAPGAGPDTIIEAGDMSAFVALIAADFAAKKNAGAWGFLVIDALADGDVAQARLVLDEMALQRRQPETLSADELKPWVLAAEGDRERALLAIAALSKSTPPPIHRAQKALLLEGLGDLEGALAAYEEGPDEVRPPSAEDAARPDYLVRLLNYSLERKNTLRHAEFLRSINRQKDAVELLERLAAADPDDGYIDLQLREARAPRFTLKPRTLNQAFASALGDQADSVEERQGLLGAVMARGQKPPFNHLVSALRQSALLLDPDNGPVRLTEVNQLHAQGKFETALRLAQLGDPPANFRAELLVAAAKSALELEADEAVEGLVALALKADGTALSKLSAADALASVGRTEQAIDLIDEALKARLSDRERVFAVLAKSDAYFQAGDVASAVRYARDARAIEDNENTRQYLASMLVRTADRQEGLDIMRKMLAETPGDTGLMNNLGYSLIDDHRDAVELEEGFKLLKEASRLSPNEPNLLDSIGWGYYLYGDFKEAKKYLERAIEAFKPFDHWELHDHMGDVHWRLGDRDAARASWSAALKARPPAPKAKAIGAKITSGLTTPAPEPRSVPEVPLPLAEDARDI